MWYDCCRLDLFTLNDNNSLPMEVPTFKQRKNSVILINPRFILLLLCWIGIAITSSQMSQTVCLNPAASWPDTLYCISPYSMAYMGIGLALGISIVGAGW